MNLSQLREWLSWITDAAGDDYSFASSEGNENSLIFEPVKRLCERDYVIIDMLNSAGHEYVSFCVTDPSLPDNPIIFVSQGFCNLTGYDYDEVVGRNCRFLQGAETDRCDIERISQALKDEIECSVNLLNYKKDGTTFINELRTPTRELAYFIGIQVAVDSQDPGQMPSNPGWVYTLGNHV
mmetsp:Transcript_12674/g.25520  ORF Transcript_12674/g.25520 Transcript_12674/m.25520 type:complete len:181 (+) Transcript_12674:180-722(+)